MLSVIVASGQDIIETELRKKEGRNHESKNIFEHIGYGCVPC
jgi:16S rRNA U516 pseudouridylate synthase RsuA-like enzyme